MTRKAQLPIVDSLVPWLGLVQGQSHGREPGTKLKHNVKLVCNF